MEALIAESAPEPKARLLQALKVSRTGSPPMDFLCWRPRVGWNVGPGACVAHAAGTAGTAGAVGGGAAAEPHPAAAAGAPEATGGAWQAAPGGAGGAGEVL